MTASDTASNRTHLSARFDAFENAQVNNDPARQKAAGQEPAADVSHLVQAWRLGQDFASETYNAVRVKTPHNSAATMQVMSKVITAGNVKRHHCNSIHTYVSRNEPAALQSYRDSQSLA